MHRLFRLIIPLLLLAVTVGVASAQDRSFVWQQLDTVVDVRSDGVLGVSETLTLRYNGGPFTFAFRDLPNRRLDGITNITVADAEGAYQQVTDEESTQPRTFSVFTEDGAQRVRWVYPPTSDTTRTFTLRYDVAGAVRRYSDTDEVWWSMVFPDREENVEQASGIIRLPQAVAANKISADAPDFAAPNGIGIGSGEAQVRATNIPGGEELTLRVRFPKGIVGGAAPAWQGETEWQENYNATTRPTVNVLLSLLSALAIGGAGVGAWLWRRDRRDPQSNFAGTVYSPPDTMRPAEVAKLLGESDNQAFTATMFDLANRGYLAFREEQGGWGSKAVRAVRVRADVNALDLVEQRVMAALFDGSDETVLNGSNKAIVSALPDVGKLTQARIEALGLIDPVRRDQRGSGNLIGGGLMAIGIVGTIISFFFAETISFWLPVLGVAVAVAGVLWLIVAGSVRGLTEQGAETLARWRGFKQHLNGLAVGEGPEGHFDRLLPYAVALGDAKTLTHSYQNTREPLPVWYYPVVVGQVGHGGGGGGGVSIGGGEPSLLLQDFSQNFLSSLSTTSSAATSPTSSSGSGSGGGSSGGGGGGAG